MGSITCDAVEADVELELAARLGRGDELDQLRANHVDVAVDFTVPAAVADHALYCIDNGIHVVVGTSGLTDEDLEEIARRAAETDVGVVVVPNFAVGAVLMMRFASEAARFFQRAEIVERHHERKLDAPSGTALRTAAAMNEQRREPWVAAADDDDAVAAARGTSVGGIRLHSLRVPGSVAHQEVVLGGRGETLTIRHDSLDRSSFMPGVILAIKKVVALRGLTVGLEHLLGI